MYIYVRECARKCICVCEQVYVYERECMREIERMSVYIWKHVRVCVRDRERGERMCIWERVCVWKKYIYIYLCMWERKICVCTLKCKHMCVLRERVRVSMHALRACVYACARGCMWMCACVREETYYMYLKSSKLSESVSFKNSYTK